MYNCFVSEKSNISSDRRGCGNSGKKHNPHPPE